MSVNERKRLRKDGNGQNSNGAAQVPQYIPKVKSCIECRQHKIKCDVVKEPFKACSHCTRMKKDCKIDLDYKRVSKRNQLEVLKEQVRDLQRQLEQSSTNSSATSSFSPGMANTEDPPLPSLGGTAKGQSIDAISLSAKELEHLFELFFKFYHPFCPLLDPKMDSDYYFNLSSTLGWTVVIIAARRYSLDAQLLTKLIDPYNKLLWATVGNMPQRYHTVKALALLCTWPIPIVRGNISQKSESVDKTATLGLSEIDPTFMLSGIMMQIALQSGLHKTPLPLDSIMKMRNITQAEIEDRQLTWAVCNIVSQSVSLTSGQPSRSIYDWHLGGRAWNELSEEVELRLRVEKFSDIATRSLYSNSSEIISTIAEEQLLAVLGPITADLETLNILSSALSPFNYLSLLATKVHFHSFAFFLPQGSPIRLSSLTAAYNTSIDFIQGLLDHDMTAHSVFHYCTSYLLRTLLTASCVLLKILNSSIAPNFNTTHGRTMFNACVLAIRSVSVRNNDFPDRVAETQTRMWRAAGGGFDTQKNGLRETPLGSFDHLNLKIRSRMSVSLVYDAIWTWRMSMRTREPTEAQDINAVMDNVVPAPVDMFQEQPNLLSNMQDFELLNGLDWNLDENLFFWD